MMNLDALPAVPGAIPVAGHARLLKAQRLQFFERALHTAPLSRFSMYGRQVMCINSPEAAGELLITNAKSTRKSPGLRLLLGSLAGDGLFTSEGDLWRRQRRLMAPLFQPSVIGRYAELMTRSAREVALSWKPGQSIDLAHEMMRVTMMVVGRTLFGTEAFSEADELGQCITTLLGWVNDNMSSSKLIANVVLVEASERWLPKLTFVPEPWRKRVDAMVHRPVLMPSHRSREILEAKGVLDRRLEALISARRANRTGANDLLTKLLDAQDADGTVMTDKQLRDEAATLFVAGHETTANGLAWALALLARNPSFQTRLQNEVDALAGQPAGFEDVMRVPTAIRTFKEALRLYPPVTLLLRQAIEPFTLAGIQLRKGSLCFVPTWSLHRNPEVWPNPQVFDPDRFTAEAEAKRHKAAWLPFGLGPRVCIGNHFAMLEGPLVLATLLQHARLEVDTARDMSPDDFATLRPRGGVWARAWPRAQA